MTYRNVFTIAFIVMFMIACVPSQPGLTAAPSQDATFQFPTATVESPTDQLPAPTTTVVPLPIPTETLTPLPPPESKLQFIAYVRDGQLLVTDATNGIQGGTTQYTVAGESDQVMDIAWSPSGEFVAFVSTAKGEPHLFYIFALGQSSPTDLGPGSAFAWSPNSQSLAFVRDNYPDGNLWITTVENAAPRQLTFETNDAWGRPVFTPDGQALIVAGADRNNMGAQGNTSFTLEQLTLDGSGARTPLPGATPLDGVRLPDDLRFSPDGKRLAFSTSSHISACAAPGAYYVSNADGGNRQELISPSLRPAIDPSKEHYHVGLNYSWTTASDALIALGNVVDCDFNSPTIGQTLAGPQMSILGLDGSERTIIPGTFYGISMDRTGTWIAAAHYKDYQDLNPMLEIYSAQTGQLALALGPGSLPQFQP
jgi:WD40 repeat protein